MEERRSSVTKFVLDASVAAAWTLPDEASPEAAALLDKAADGVLAPFHYPSEIANVVLMAQRRGRVLVADTEHQRRQGKRHVEVSQGRELRPRHAAKLQHRP